MKEKHLIPAHSKELDEVELLNNEYDACVRQRSSLTLWLTSEAIHGWAAPRRKTKAGQPRYS
ncbi:hypothetical protein PR017_24040 (plasmid) [Rhizobium tumorigenes]|uniref:IS5/IS1182 family transposase n=1 Tax=Rhizobium tumorigenes TaxID=2041385 RepID=A0AAF1KT32_9HYPH|nr:hypothetical protein [Rhizobium tumorigenes]WFR98772.1 hypothetical protein PR017_24040 [Rhizobium tumorigenes]